MSCQRCGGVLAAELAAAMYDLVCEKAVIQNRYCHCDDVVDPVETKLPLKGRGFPQESRLKSLHRKGGYHDRLWETRAGS